MLSLIGTVLPCLAFLATVIAVFQNIKVGRSPYGPFVSGVVGVVLIGFITNPASFQSLTNLFRRATDEWAGSSSSSSRPAPSHSSTVSSSSTATHTSSPSSSHGSSHAADQGASVPWSLVGAVVAVIVALGVAALLVVWARHLAATSKARREEAAAEREKLRAHRADQDAKWARLVKDESDASARWMAYQTDLSAILARPLLQDSSDPRVERVVAAMLRARDVKPSVAPLFGLNEYAADHPFAKATHEFVAALDEAEKAADMVKDSQFARDERKRISDARKILAMALDEANGAARETYYKRVLSLLEGLIVVPPQAMLQIESALGLRQIESGEGTSGSTVSVEKVKA